MIVKWMMELVVMPWTSPMGRIRRLGTSNPKQVRGGFRGPFCMPNEEVPKCWFGELFYIEVSDPSVVSRFVETMIFNLKSSWCACAPKLC